VSRHYLFAQKTNWGAHCKFRMPSMGSSLRLFLFALFILPVAALANSPQETTYSASQLGLSKYFANATVTFAQVSPIEYDATFDLGEMTAPRSGQDFMLFPLAQVLLIHCTVWRLAAKAGYSAVLFRTPKEQPPRGPIRAHLTLTTQPVSALKPSPSEEIFVLDLTTQEFQASKTRLCERSPQDLNEKPW